MKRFFCLILALLLLAPAAAADEEKMTFHLEGASGEIGDTVTGGQIIGGVGSTGLFESLEPAHLHFEMLKGGAYVNPADYIKF